MKSTLAVIPARGGSKRIPRKNIKSFCGKPIIAYSIEAALESEIFDEVIVSTDDEEIASIAKEYGADVPFMRSEKTANDYAVIADVLTEVLLEYKERGKEFDYVCCIYPTAPFVTGEKLEKSFQILREEEKDCVMPVVEFSFPPLRGMIVKDGVLQYKWKEYSLTRSQDLEKIYYDSGQFVFLKVEPFLQSGRIVMKNTGAIIVSELEVQDIDNETDWKLAELKFQMQQNKDR